jgi:hypothetical protein
MFFPNFVKCYNENKLQLNKKLIKIVDKELGESKRKRETERESKCKGNQSIN